jgi:hypothetical protein
MIIYCCDSSYSTGDITSIIAIVIAVITVIATFIGIRSNELVNRMQSSENTIIKQLEFHYNILNSINVDISLAGRGYGVPNIPTTANGSGAFEIFYEIFKDIYIKMPGYFEDTIEGEERRVTDSFTQLYNVHGSQFGNYFKNLYLLVTYVDKLNYENFDKKYYIDLIKSQLSKYEILLLAYDCLWIQDQKAGKNFIEFAKKYDLLSALETNELIKSASSIKHEIIFEKQYQIVFNKPKTFSN